MAYLNANMALFGYIISLTTPTWLKWYRPWLPPYPSGVGLKIENDVNMYILVGRHGYRSKKFPAATDVRDYVINFAESPKKLKKCVIFCNPNWVEVLVLLTPL